MGDREVDDWTMPAESHWFAKPHRSVRVYGLEMLVVSAVLVVFGLILVGGSRGLSAPAVGCVLLLIGLIWPSAFYLHNLRWAHFVATKQDLDLVESLTDPYWIVEMTVIRDRLVSATDHGVLSFSNGALYFYGCGCSFLIGSQDIGLYAPRLDGSGWRRPVHFKSRQPWTPRQVLRLKHPAAEIELGFTILAVPKKDLEEQTAQLDEALRTFTMGDPTALERSYPPLWPFDPYTLKPKAVSS